MNVVDIKVGAEGDFQLNLLTGGVIQITLDDKTPGLSGAVQINIPPKYFLDALKMKYSGNILVSGLIGIFESLLYNVP
jgi:hypothetical protein